VVPEFVAAGDVNEDGCPDVLVLDSLDIARVFPGNCDGTVQAQSNEFGEGDMAGAAMLADINGDGHLDLIYPGVWAGTGGYGQTAGNLLGVNFGDGHGNFANANVYRGGQTSFSLAVADLNHDGHLDVITANQDSDSVSMFLNDGNGGFGVPTGAYIGYINGNNSSGPINAPDSGPTLVDVNGDGKPDLVELEVGPTGFPIVFQVAAMLNDGTGHFGAVTRSPITGPINFGWVTDYLLGDFRNTGYLDIVTLASDNYSPELGFASNTGNGSFSGLQITSIPQGDAVAAGDFNRDGKLDLAIASGSSTGTATVTIYVGHGDGTFAAQTPITFNTNSAGHWVAGLWVGDFNSDGKLDILIWFYLNVVPFQNNDVYELLGNGDGTFQPAKLVISNLTNPAVADLNNDGLPDVVENVSPMVNYPVSGGLSTFKLFLCQHDGSFVASNTYAPYAGDSLMPNLIGSVDGGRLPAWIGDFNGDGNVDLAAIQQAPGYPTRMLYVQFLLGDGDGTFTPTYEPYYLNASVPSAAYDVTGDGKADLVEIDGYTSSFQVIPEAPGAAMTLQLVSDPVIGTQGSVQVSLASISSSDTLVTLAASDSAITIPATVTIPAGSLTQTISFSIGSSFNSTHVFWIQGSLNGSVAIVYGTQALTQGQYGFAISTYSSTQATFPGLPTADYQVGVRSLDGYSTTTAMSCQGLPVGASCQFGSNPLSIVRGGASPTSLTISTSSSTPFGVYPVLIVASDGVITSTVTVTLDVGDYSVSVTPASKTVLQNTTATYTIGIVTTNNYGGGFTASCSGLPSPAACNASVFNVSAQTNSLPIGNYTFEVSLSNGVASRSASAQLNIGDYSAALSSSSLTVGAGQSGNVTITVTGQNGFVDSVALTCNGAPSGTACSVDPGSVSPSAGTTATLTVNVTTKPARVVGGISGKNFPVSLSLAGIVGIFLLTTGHGRRKRMTFPLMALLLTLNFIASCGGGISSGSVGNTGTSGGGGGGGNSAPSSFSLTVQGTSEGVSKDLGTIQITVP
jgi:hypothetical protein